MILNKYTFFLFLMAFMAFIPTRIFAQCQNDEMPPTAVCFAQLMVQDDAESGAVIEAQSLNAGSNDNCTEAENLDFRIEFTTDNVDTPPETRSIELPAVAGTYEVSLWVGDEAGNWGICWSTVTVSIQNSNCENDTTAPSVICINGLTANVDVGEIFAADFDAGTADNCTEQVDLIHRIEYLDDFSEGEVPETSSLSFPSFQAIYNVAIWIGDQAGNWDYCTTYFVVEGSCEGEMIPPAAVCQTNLQVTPHPINGAVINVEDINEGSFDNCSDVTLQLLLWNQEFDDVVVTDSLIIFPPVIREYTVALVVTDENGNENTCWTTINITGVLTAFHGQIFVDDNDNCELDAAEENTGFEGWKIRATELGNETVSETFTDENGGYQLSFLARSSDDIQLEVILPNGQSSACNSSVVLTDALGGYMEQNFSVQSIDDCSYLTVDVSTPFLRRCFPNEYAINYSNYSSFDIENGTINVLLDPKMTILTADFPYTILADESILFELESIPAISGGLIHFTVLLSCEAVIGQTHCVTAKILPFDCLDENQFAHLKIEGSCDDALSQVHFKITNTGSIGMTQSLQAIVVEDVLMYMHGAPIDLDAGESMEFDFPANGATWRYQIEQDPSYPYGGIAASFVEGCGGFTPNIATQFSLTDPTPNISVDCQENVGSWDPNDKQAFPRGTSTEHFIEANTPIEYLIRFQNTGTDTAFTVVVEDQLSEWLNPATLRPGASSHPYRLEQKENGRLLFHFDNIMLPDSNINQAASNGFIKFNVEQILDAPLGTTINNTANIYFDFNDAVVTNTIRHTIGENIMAVATQEAFIKGVNVEVYPNPLQTEGVLVLNNYSCQNGNLQLFDAIGRLIKEETFTGHQASLDRKDFMSSGLYFFQITDQGQLITQGRLIVD